MPTPGKRYPRVIRDPSTEIRLPTEGETLCLMTLARGTVTRHPLKSDVVIGRSEQADVRIDDTSVSRRHAIVHVGDALEVEDLGSANGTFVRRAANDPTARHRIEGRVKIDVGDFIEVGSVVLVVWRGDVPEVPVEETLPPDIVVVDPAVRELHSIAHRVAGDDISVLLLGETGVGKEVFAEAIHRASRRKDKPFLRLNCAALTETLLESELFGHERGAFTGATQTKPGLLESATSGTVFLDEVGELPLTVQAKLLRVIEERSVLRLGSLTPRPIDVRFIAATNRDLEGEIERGAFRRDLFFRINGITLHIPALRDRPREIEELARRFAGLAAQRRERAVPKIAPAALDALRSYAWPGNIRELRNVIDRAVLLCDNELRAEHLGLGTRAPEPKDLREDVDEFEKKKIVAALEKCGGNQTRAAKMLGISRRTLTNRLNEYGLPRPLKGK
jgi:two-component system, NtrC family, response regulator AtoC